MSEDKNKVEFGSEAHAALLGLRRAESGEKGAIEGWVLVDITQFGTGVTQEFLREVLRQRVAELGGVPKVFPKAPAMFVPEALA